MAIVTNKKYENYTPASVLIDDMRAAWEWSAITEDSEKGSTKLHINENTYIEIYEDEGYSEKTHSTGSPTIKIYFKGALLYTKGGLTTLTNKAAFLYIVKTNKATIFQYDYQDKAAYEADKGSAMFIISNATDYIRGDDTPVLSVFESSGVSMSGGYNLAIVLGDDIAADAIVKNNMYGSLNQNKTILMPMYCSASTYILDHVYLMYQSQLTGLQRGECKLNGRDYYVFNWLIIPDE